MSGSRQDEPLDWNEVAVSYGWDCPRCQRPSSECVNYACSEATQRFRALTPDERAEKIVRSPSMFAALRRYREKRHPGSTTPRADA